MKRARNYEVHDSNWRHTRSFGSLRSAREFIKRQLAPSNPKATHGWRVMWITSNGTQTIRHKVTGKVYQPYPRETVQ